MYRAKVESFTPLEIKKANAARTKLKALCVIGYKSILKIVDERKIDTPGSPFNQFLKEQWKNVDRTDPAYSFPDTSKKITGKWRVMSDAEKQVRFNLPECALYKWLIYCIALQGGLREGNRKIQDFELVVIVSLR